MDVLLKEKPNDDRSNTDMDYNAKLEMFPVTDETELHNIEEILKDDAEMNALVLYF